MYSPLQSVEPILVELILQKAQMGQHINMKDSLHLANSLIQGSDYQKAMVIFKKKLGYTGESLEQLGPQLWKDVQHGIWTSPHSRNHRETRTTKMGQLQGTLFNSPSEAAGLQTEFIMKHPDYMIL